MPPRLSLPRLELPPSPAALALLAVLFALPGLAGHDLWKTHDAIGLGIVHGMAATGDLLVPRIAGLPWMHDPPLFHWIALAFGAALDSFLPFHSAARLASGALVLASVFLLYVAARQWSSQEESSRTTAAAAVLLVLGSVGLLVHAHEALPELAALAALCGALAALALAERRPLAAGAGFGAALGLAFLSSSWIAPAAIALAAVAAHLACPPWRERRGAAFLAAALAVCLPVALSWPIALASASPHAFLEWWSLAWASQGAPLANLLDLAETASWFAWPAWPLALWTAWALRARWREPRLFVPAAATLAMLAGLVWWGPAQDVNLIPLLAPLALFASHAVPVLRRGAAAALDWFGALTFAFFGALLWLGYIAMTTGVPPKIAHNFARAAPGFAAELDGLRLIGAAAFTLGWLYLMLFTAPSPLRSVARWAAGIVFLWGVGSMLLMPWADYQKSYRPVALQLRSKIPVGAGCVASKALGVSQAAALDYYAGIRTLRFDPLRPLACALVLVQGGPRDEFDAPGAGWTKLADVGRPGDRSERYRLYVLDR